VQQVSCCPQHTERHVLDNRLTENETVITVRLDVALHERTISREFSQHPASETLHPPSKIYLHNTITFLNFVTSHSRRGHIASDMRPLVEFSVSMWN
jgi:hypothetical protein